MAEVAVNEDVITQEKQSIEVTSGNAPDGMQALASNLIITSKETGQPKRLKMKGASPQTLDEHFIPALREIGALENTEAGLQDAIKDEVIADSGQYLEEIGQSAHGAVFSYVSKGGKFTIKDKEEHADLKIAVYNGKGRVQTVVPPMTIRNDLQLKMNGSSTTFENIVDPATIAAYRDMENVVNEAAEKDDVVVVMYSTSGKADGGFAIENDADVDMALTNAITEALDSGMELADLKEKLENEFGFSPEGAEYITAIAEYEALVQDLKAGDLAPDARTEAIERLDELNSKIEAFNKADLNLPEALMDSIQSRMDAAKETFSEMDLASKAMLEAVDELIEKLKAELENSDLDAGAKKALQDALKELEAAREKGTDAAITKAVQTLTETLQNPELNIPAETLDAITQTVKDSPALLQISEANLATQESFEAVSEIISELETALKAEGLDPEAAEALQAALDQLVEAKEAGTAVEIVNAIENLAETLENPAVKNALPAETLEAIAQTLDENPALSQSAELDLAAAEAIIDMIEDLQAQLEAGEIDALPPEILELMEQLGDVIELVQEQGRDAAIQQLAEALADPANAEGPAAAILDAVQDVVVTLQDPVLQNELPQDSLNAVNQFLSQNADIVQSITQNAITQQLQNTLNTLGPGSPEAEALKAVLEQLQNGDDIVSLDADALSQIKDQLKGSDAEAAANTIDAAIKAQQDFQAPNILLASDTLATLQALNVDVQTVLNAPETLQELGVENLAKAKELQRTLDRLQDIANAMQSSPLNFQLSESLSQSQTLQNLSNDVSQRVSDLSDSIKETAQNDAHTQKTPDVRPNEAFTPPKSTNDNVTAKDNVVDLKAERARLQTPERIESVRVPDNAKLEAVRKTAEIIVLNQARPAAEPKTPNADTRNEAKLKDPVQKTDVVKLDEARREPQQNAPLAREGDQVVESTLNADADVQETVIEPTETNKKVQEQHDLQSSEDRMLNGETPKEMDEQTKQEKGCGGKSCGDCGKCFNEESQKGAKEAARALLRGDKDPALSEVKEMDKKTKQEKGCGGKSCGDCRKCFNKESQKGAKEAARALLRGDKNPASSEVKEMDAKIKQAKGCGDIPCGACGKCFNKESQQSAKEKARALLRGDQNNAGRNDKKASPIAAILEKQSKNRSGNSPTLDLAA